MARTYKADLITINNIIYAQGACLGSPEYFKIREIAARAERGEKPVDYRALLEELFSLHEPNGRFAPSHHKTTLRKVAKALNIKTELNP